MKILAVEFSSERRSVAVADRRDRNDVAVLGLACEARVQQTLALTMVEQALASAGIEREAIDCIAVGLGPGSYTGIRASISLAQGWQLARGTNLLGIGSVECLVAQAQSQGVRGAASFVIDAQRGEFYLARYEVSAAKVRVAENLRIVSRDEIRRRLEAGDAVLGPEAARWFSGAKDLFPDAATLARLTAQRTDFVPGEKLEPIYLREVQFVKAAPPRFPPGAPPS
jgi:tRNA threonylcarbamoyl adenosine modification protein YeaZ